MTALNVTQMVIMSARAILILTFAISPMLQDVCAIRRWGGLISSQLLPPIAWAIMFVRMQNLFKNKPVVLWVVGVLLVLAFGCTFPQTILYGYNVDKYVRCTLIVHPFGKMLFFSVDVVIQVVECSMFVFVIIKHLRSTHSVVANRLRFLVKCSLRAAFIDCAFTVLGLSFTIASIPSPYALFVFHIVDYGKIFASWLFVMDSMYVPENEDFGESGALLKLSTFKKSTASGSKSITSAGGGSKRSFVSSNQQTYTIHSPIDTHSSPTKLEPHFEINLDQKQKPRFMLDEDSGYTSHNNVLTSGADYRSFETGITNVAPERSTTLVYTEAQTKILQKQNSLSRGYLGYQDAQDSSAYVGANDSMLGRSKSMNYHYKPADKW
ncbi:hypothetical protein HK098_007284 [Nowakowskiella sp. JEL0407]|nr:hypothetical protein HK098_007272 [Nowakowskiella sp. JEL0407]KAJ3126690.1 hypothetical protein HK098_007284 [Nowakowskiella sp. JEL0407]